MIEKTLQEDKATKMESFNQKNLTPKQERTQMTHEIGLGEFIAKVKEDLKPTQESPIFFLESAELEIHVAVSKEGTLGGDIRGKSDLKINVLGFDLVKLGEAGVGVKTFGNLGRQDIHTIKVTLTPILTKEEITSSLSQEEWSHIRQNIKQKIMRGEKEERVADLSGKNLSEEKSKKVTTTPKVMRG